MLKTHLSFYNTMKSSIFAPPKGQSFGTKVHLHTSGTSQNIKTSRRPAKIFFLTGPSDGCREGWSLWPCRADQFRANREAAAGGNVGPDDAGGLFGLQKHAVVKALAAGDELLQAIELGEARGGIVEGEDLAVD